MYFNLRKWYRTSTDRDSYTWVKGLHGVKVTEDEDGFFVTDQGFTLEPEWVSKQRPKPILITDTKYWKWTFSI